MLNTKYNFPRNVIDITTVEPTTETKSYVIDQRLLDNLLSRITKGTLDDIKEDIKEEVLISKTKDELFKRLDDYIYINNIIDLININTPANKESADDVFNTKEVNKSY